MLEVEIKFPVKSHAAIEAQLAALSASRKEQREEIDHYFNAPDRDFAQTDEALRIRQIGRRNFVTYKGPKRDLQTKTRTEIEVPLQDGEEIARQMAELLKSLGYKPVAVLRKARTIYETEKESFHLEVCLDRVSGLGDFVELEVIAPEEQVDAARKVLHDMAAKLGLVNSERRSYLELWLSKQ